MLSALPITRGMEAALLEPISPELALVCPELRRQAIAVLPDFTRPMFVVQAGAGAGPESRNVAEARLLREIRGAVVEMIMLLPWAVGTFVGATAVTLAMTLIADATR